MPLSRSGLHAPPAARRRPPVVLAALALFLFLAGCAGRPPPTVPSAPPLPPLPEVRQVNLLHRPSGERAAVVYFRNGRYDPVALAQVSRLLRDRNDGAVPPDLDPELLDFLVDLLLRAGLPQTTEVHVLSGFRSPASNARLVRTGVPAARDSLHLVGRALDFRVPVLPGAALSEIAKTMQRGGAAFYDDSGHIHIDTGPVRTWATRAPRRKGQNL